MASLCGDGDLFQHNKGRHKRKKIKVKSRSSQRQSKRMAEDFPEFYFSTRRDELVNSLLYYCLSSLCACLMYINFYYIRRPAEELSLGKFMTMER